MKISKIRFVLLCLFTLSCLTAFYWHTKYQTQFQIIIPQKTTYYTPGQQDNCKWVVHISREVTTREGDMSPAQIGIPEVAGNGYISGVVQSGPGKSIIMAFNLPKTVSKLPPIIMIASYNNKTLPIKTIRFRVMNSTLMSMSVYSSYEKCIEATMK